MRYRLIIILLFFPFHLSANELITTFEKDSDGKLIGWFTPSPETGSIDTEMLYEGQTSFRLTRPPGFEEKMVFVLQGLPLNFQAEEVELRARLKAQGTGPWAGVNIMLRQDVADNAIEFNNSQPFITGRDTNWVEVKLAQQINPQAETLVFGAVLIGPGTAWVSDVELWADGERVTKLPDVNEDADLQRTENRLDHLLSHDIDWSSFSEEQVEDMASLIQVWGFLKYFHPQVAQGDLNWDAPFIRSAQDLMQGQALNQVLSALLEEAGEFDYSETVARKVADEALEVLVDGRLQENPAISPQIRSVLNDLQANRDQFGEGRYAFADGMGLPVFAREQRYREHHLRPEMQLLALARVWNIVEYWFPYREQLSGDWHAALREAIPGVVQAQDQSELHYQIQALMTKTEDGHAGVVDFFETPFGICRLPFGVRYLEEAVVVTQVDESFDNDSVQQGDTINAINGVPMSQLIEEWLPLVPASNPVEQHYMLAHSLMSRPCDEAATQVRINRDGQYHDVDMGAPQVILSHFPHTRPGDPVQVLPEGVTYINATRLAQDDVDEAVEQAAESGRLILDLRGYPQDFVVYHLGSRLVHEPTLFSHVAFVQPKSPGRVSIIDHVLTLEPYEPVNMEAIAILVNESTMSQAEFTALAWRESSNAVVVGSTTAGAVGNSRSIVLPDGALVYFTGGRMLDKNKQDVQFQGIVPDHYIKPSIEDIRQGRDVVFEKALEVVGAR